MAATSKTTKAQTIDIKPLQRKSIKVRIIGETEMFQNRMAQKAMQTLLVGGQKKGKADRAAIKHDPIAEFRNSAEMLPDGPTALGLRVVAVKAAMCTAALETEGMTKTGTQRLLFMPGDHVPLYGTPLLRMDIVRSADINRTPDVRSRAFLPKWGAEIEIKFIVPQLSSTGVVSLLSNAGVLVGLGDFRQEKGKGAYGSFRVITTDEKDDEWDDLIKNHGRKAQEAALADPQFANAETAELMEFFFGEVRRRAA